MMKSTALLVPFLVLAACEVGEVPIGGMQTPTVDAPTQITPTADAPIIVQAACEPRANPVTQAHIHSAGASSNAGQNCLQAGCHLSTNTGVQAPGFQFAGTLMGAATPTLPNAGATIIIAPSGGGGTPKKITTDTAGNFYLEAGQLPGAFPAMVSASVCATGMTTGNPTPMTAALTSGQGGCAMTGCHVSGAQGAITLDPTGP